MRDVLVNSTVSGTESIISLSRPGQKPGPRLNGATLKITGVPSRVKDNEVLEAVRVSAIWWFPDGPFEIPWDLLGFNEDGSISLITAKKVAQYYENHPKA